MNDFLRAAAGFVVAVYFIAFAAIFGANLPWVLIWAWERHVLDLTVAGILLPIVAVSYLAYDHAG